MNASTPTDVQIAAQGSEKYVDELRPTTDILIITCSANLSIKLAYTSHREYKILVTFLYRNRILTTIRDVYPLLMEIALMSSWPVSDGISSNRGVFLHKRPITKD